MPLPAVEASPRAGPKSWCLHRERNMNLPESLEILDAHDPDLPTPPAEIGPEYPVPLARAGSGACHAAHEFFHAGSRTPIRAVPTGAPCGSFWPGAPRKATSWRASPGLAGQYFHSLDGATASKNLALSALRHFFDALVTRHAVLLNPFHSVRGLKHSRTHGKTPELTISQARRLIASLDTTRTVGLRDRALLGTMITTGARIGALSRLRIGDLQEQDGYRILRFREKGGKERDVPVRSDLDEWLTAYMAAAGMEDDPRAAPLWPVRSIRETRCVRTVSPRTGSTSWSSTAWRRPSCRRRSRLTRFG